MASIDWLERISAIRAWQRHGIRAPHKPLLLLYALGQLQLSQAPPEIPFTEAEERLKALLEEYGPPRPTSAGYPFHHLTSDNGLWEVRTIRGAGSPGPNLTDLRGSEAVGRLAPAFAEDLLADPGLVARTARYLLDANFPETVHAELLASVGLDLDVVTDGEIVDMATRRRRDPAFRTAVLLAYEARCAFCGWTGTLSGDAVGVEAAHIRWFNIDGPDTVDNGLCLCSLHHKLLDKGAIGITPDLTIAVSLAFVGHGDTAKHLVYDLNGRRVESPQLGQAPPSPTYIEWHASEVFRAPARA